MDTEFRLQLLSHDSVFSTREDAMEYINDNFKYEALYAEPALFLYGSEKSPYFILAFGAGNKKITFIDSGHIEESIEEIKNMGNDNADGLASVNEKLLGIISATGITFDENKKKDQITYEPDTHDKVIGDAENIAEAVRLLSEYIQLETEGGDVLTEDTNSVALTSTVGDDKNVTIKADVKISEAGSNDDLDFNNNMIGVKDDGLYAASNLEYDEETHKLTYTASGMKNGVFKNDATRKVINLGEHSLYTAKNEGHNVSVSVAVVDSNKSTISADVKLSEDENNSLVIKDGALFSSKRAKDVLYGNTNVAKKLNDVTAQIEEINDTIDEIKEKGVIEGDESDTTIVNAKKNTTGGFTITADVRLSKDDSVVVSEGGLSANVDFDIDVTSNTLTLKRGNKTKTMQLPGVSMIKDSYYDAANKNLVLETSDGSVIRIPVADMLVTWLVDNDSSSPVVLLKTSGASSEPDKLSASLKVSPTDNLLGIDGNGYLYVSETNINNKVSAEATRATEAEEELRSSIETSNENIANNAASIANVLNKADNNATAISNEINRAKEQEGLIQTSVNTNSADITTLRTSVQENKDSITANSTAISKEISDRKDADTGLTASVSELSGKIEAEVTRATNKENDLVSNISSNSSAISSEVARAQGAENTLNERISSNTTQINTISSNITERLQTTLDSAKSYTDLEISKINNTSSSNATDAKNEAISASKEYTDEKVSDVLAKAKAYTDVEAARAANVEQTNASDIDDLETSVASIQTELAKKIETVTVEPASTEDHLNYNVYVDGKKVGEINIPKDQNLADVTYNSTSKEIEFVFNVTDGTKITKINIADLIDTYNAGNGLALEDNVFSVKKDSASEKYLTVSADGIKVAGIDAELAKKANVADVYTKTETDAKYLTEHQDISALATKDEVGALTSDVTAAVGRITTAEGKIDIINGNSAQEGSILKTLADSKSYTDAKIEDAVSEINEDINSISTTVATKANSSDVYTKSEIDSRNFMTSDNTSSFALKSEVVEEISRAKAAEQANATSVENLKETVNTNKTDIANLKAEATRLNTTSVETNTVKIDLDKESTGTKISANLKLDMGVANILRVSGNGLYADVEMSYNKASNTITFNNGISTQSFQLTNQSVVVGGVYDSAAKAIVLTVETSDGTQNISIPVGDLIHTLKVENTTENPIKLSLAQGSDGIDVLTARVDISTKEDNALLRDNGTLYVSSSIDNLTGYYGGEKMSLQGIVNVLREKANEIDSLSRTVEELDNDVTTVKGEISTLRTTVDGQNSKISSIETKCNNLESTVEGYNTRIQNAESSVSIMRSELTELAETVRAIQDEIGGTGSGMSIKDRLSKLEETVNNFIDFADPDGDGVTDGY